LYKHIFSRKVVLPGVERPVVRLMGNTQETKIAAGEC